LRNRNIENYYSMAYTYVIGVFKKTLKEKTATEEKKKCWNARKQKKIIGRVGM